MNFTLHIGITYQLSKSHQNIFLYRYFHENTLENHFHILQGSTIIKILTIIRAVPTLEVRVTIMLTVLSRGN